MTRKECLDKAAECVLRDRASQYGGPEDSFGVIANFWSVYLGRKVYPHDVAMMMSLLKIARIKGNRGYKDGYIDLAGYAACGAECAEGKPAPKADEEPKFKPGDKVEFYEYNPNGNMWMSAEYIGRRNEVDRSWHAVKRLDSGEVALVHCGHLRNAEVKAEGCEELVQKDLADECGGCLYRLASDAPRTPEETCQRIVDSNPSIYPRKPTGEELAEMAEEKPDGH